MKNVFCVIWSVLFRRGELGIRKKVVYRLTGIMTDFSVRYLDRVSFRIGGYLESGRYVKSFWGVKSCALRLLISKEGVDLPVAVLVEEDRVGNLSYHLLPESVGCVEQIKSILLVKKADTPSLCVIYRKEDDIRYFLEPSQGLGFTNELVGVIKQQIVGRFKKGD